MNRTPFVGRRVHLMGIAGAGMSALVPLLREVGAEVDGCDLADSPVVGRLRAAGVPVALGHAADHADDCDILVYTSAVPAGHVELRQAQAAGCRVLSRAACLAELMTGTRTVAVAGSHGKTSTTWMLGHLLVAAGADPVVMVGGAVDTLGHGGGRVGGSALFVAEVDESDGGFAHVAPQVAVVTNLEAEHLRHYGDFANLCRAFHDWLAGMGPTGVAILPSSGLDPRVEADLPCRIVRFGIDAGDVCATDLHYGAEGSSARVLVDGADAGRIEVPTPGRHMLENALGAIAAARVVEPAVDLAAFKDCERVRRRFTVIGQREGVRLVEDYAHHPTEIAAVIAAASLAGGQVHVLFQPHRYTRTIDCFDEFVTCFDGAASVVLLPVYAASEAPVPGADAASLAEAVAAAWRQRGADGTAVQFSPRVAEGLAFLQARAVSGDSLLILGAGDVGAAAQACLELRS